MFAPHQIVYLECNRSRLYAEVIQILEERQMCWVRPLMLVGDGYFTPDPVFSEETVNWVESQTKPHETMVLLQDGPDMLWPIHQFQVAVDTEVIPLLRALPDKPPDALLDNNRTQAMRRFIHQLWQNNSPAAPETI